MRQYDKYGELATHNEHSTIQNGRYPSQAAAEKYLPEHVSKLLDIQNSDTVLDVGCGSGNMLIPLSYSAAQVTGVDHPSVVKALAEQLERPNMTLIGGNFHDLNFDTSFDKVIAYSVLHTLYDQTEVFDLVIKLLSVLKPNGICLLGDIPNTDRKARFMNSRRGQAFQKAWEEQQQNSDGAESLNSLKVASALTVNDGFVMELIHFIRAKGYDTSWLVQPGHLPFGNTREDIIIYGPEYQL